MKSYCHIYGQLGQTGDRLAEELARLFGLGLVCDTDLGFEQAAEVAGILQPHARGDVRAFLCTATGYGTVGVRKGKPFIELVAGNIPVERIEY